ncbi:MAG: RNA polymerase sigma factor [Roseburia sp.]|nr:RNA polymerase sigma factor [Roseburia sp.]MCM1097349.1 RNA polymerase sigma factor [Ruminococcus flavefaciens]
MTKQELEICIREHGRDIYSFCRHLADDPAEADDLYQDTFLKAVELAERIEFQRNPKSYLLSIALRIWKNKKRKFAWRKRIADMQPLTDEPEAATTASPEPSPEAYAAAREQSTAIRTAVEQLPERLRIVVLLFYMEDLSAAQIAGILKIPAGTVLSRLHQARKLLKKKLEDLFYE